MNTTVSKHEKIKFHKTQQSASPVKGSLEAICDIRSNSLSLNTF